MRWLAVAIAGLAALGIAFFETFALGRVPTEIPMLDHPSDLRAGLPWGGFAGRRLSVVVEADWRRHPEAAESFLAWQLRRYPVDHSRWFHRAMMARDLGHDSQRILAHLEAAVAAQPGHREGRWRAANLAQLLGDSDLAASHLQGWLQGQPHAAGQALFAAGRWIRDTDELLDRILPDGEAYVAASLRFAREHGRVDLARAAWARLPRPRPPGDPGLLDFVDLLLAQGDPWAAMAAWRETYPDYHPGQVPNGDFRHDLGSARGLDWDTRMPAGGGASRDTGDFVSEPASLRLDFDGKGTLHLGRPSVRIPVPANPDGWVLSGYWRGSRLTTRALPYLSIRSENGVRFRADVPASTFNWEPIRIEIDGAEEASVLYLQLLRDVSVHHFDRYLAGTLWIDALNLEARAPNPGAAGDLESP